MAARTLGLAAAADAELAEPPARLSLRRRRPRWLHVHGRGRRLRLALRRGGRRAGPHPHHGHVGHARGSTATASPPIGAISAAGRWCWRLAPATGRLSQHSTKQCPRTVHCLTPFDYRGPGQLPDGGVLVVGASATGVQLAWEIHRSGRPVTLAVGEHVRLPRTYRGRDVLWWMDAAGIWNQRYDEIDDLTRARRLPSPQLVGTPERTTLDLNVLSSDGVSLVGRLAAIRDGRALFSGGLRNLFALADLKMERLLDSFDEWARTRADAGDVGPPERFAPTAVPQSSRIDLDLKERGDPDDPLGDRLPSRLPLARRARPRPQRAASPRGRRRRRRAGHVRDWPAGAAPAQIDLHSWSGRRCARHCRASGVSSSTRWVTVAKRGGVPMTTRLEQFLQDLRFGCRILTRSPGISITAVLLIALVIGGNTTVFTHRPQRAQQAGSGRARTATSPR